MDDGGICGGIVWKRLQGYSINYLINDYGIIRNLGTDQILKPTLLRGGYLRYILREKGGKRKTCLVHRLVAKAFIPNPNNLPDVDHINGVRTDNRVENLRWVSAKENMNNPITIQHIKDTVERVKNEPYFKKSRKIAVNKALIQYSKHIVCIETGEWFVSAVEASKITNITSASVLAYCDRFMKGISDSALSRKAKSEYHFRYATEEENLINLPKYRDYVNELVKTFE